jgi:hypothetical protein
MSTPANPNVDDRSNTTFFTGPVGNGTQLTGVLYIDTSTLPTADPSVAGQIWSDSGVLTVSAG